MGSVPALVLSGFDEEVIFYLLLAGFFFLVVPALAISAYVRARRLEKRPSGGDPALIARVYALEQRLMNLESSVAAPGAAPPVTARTEGRPVPPAPTPPPAAPTQPPPPPVAPTVRLVQPDLPAAPLWPRGLDLETLIAGRWL